MRRRDERRGRGIAVAAWLAAFVAAGLVVTTAAEEPVPADVRLDIEATPRVVDEGDLVEFLVEVRFVDPQSGREVSSDDEGYSIYHWGPVFDAGFPLEWDFGDGTPRSVGLELDSRTHRFVDDSAEGYEVTVRALERRGSVRVVVNNVAPSIRNVRHSRPATRGQPVAFEVSATDPGRDDELTFSWDFGDGATATGQEVEHVFEADGVYTVTVTADDGDGGQDVETLRVSVGEIGWFEVSGDVSLPATEVERLALVGTTADPLAKSTNEPCSLTISMTTLSGAPALTLKALLEPGLGERRYSIGRELEWAGTRSNRPRPAGVFFADLGLAREYGRSFGGKLVHGPFWSRGGSVSVDYFDGRHLELSFAATLVENVPGAFDPRTVFVRGFLSRRLSGSPSDVLSGLGELFSDDPEQAGGVNVYLCDREDRESFDIESRRPFPDEKNVATLDPEIEVTFTERIDPASVGSESLALGHSGHPVPVFVDGTWEPTPGDPYSVRFIPQARLRDGVNYCVYVVGGEEGVKGLDGEMLEQSSGEPSPDAPCLADPMRVRQWTFATRVDLESADVDLYQASVAGEATPLAPLKPTVARVYPFWSPDDDLDDRAKVKSFPARVTVLADGQPLYPPRRVTVRRPDLFSGADKRDARNSINFFNWRPGGLASPGGGARRIQARIEPIDASGVPVERFEDPGELVGMWNRTEILSFDYYFLRLGGECSGGVENGCGWAEAVDPESRRRGRELAFAGAEFTTQNFPVLETQPRAMGDLLVDVPAESGPCVEMGAEWAERRCFWPGTAREDSADHMLAEALREAGRDSYADVLVGFVPPGYAMPWAGVYVPFTTPGKRTILVDPAVINEVVFAHEFGHAFGLGHCPPTDGNAPCDPERIQGFRVRPSGLAGANKNRVEGNQEAAELVPLMYPHLNPVAATFIAASQYARLFDGIATAAAARPPAPAHESGLQGLRLASLLGPAPAFASEARPPASGSLVVAGRVTAAGVELGRVSHRLDGAAVRAAPPPGDWRLELLDAAGGVLESVAFAPASADPWHGLPGGTSPFRLEVPAPPGLAAVRVAGPGGRSVIRRRSPHPPALRVIAPSLESGGERRLGWAATDADGDELRFDVFLRADETGPWRALTVGSERTSLTLTPETLPAGERVRIRIEAGDGFNTVVEEVDAGPGAPFSVLQVSPVDESHGVAATTEVTAWLSEPPAPGPAAVSFRLTAADGATVPAELTIQPAVGSLTLTPLAPLEPGTRYSVTIGGLESRSGRRLATPRTWSFTTAAADEAGAEARAGEAG